MGIVDDGDAGREDFRAHQILEEAHAAGDGGAGDGAGEMPQQSGRHPRLIDHRHGLRFRFARIEPGDGAGARFAAHFFGTVEIGRMTRAGAFVAAFHAGAFAGQHRDAETVARSGIAAQKSFAGGECDRAAAEACAAAFGVRHAGHRHGRAFDRARPLDQEFGARLRRVLDIERRKRFRQTAGRRQAREFVFRGKPRHGDGALRQFAQRALRQIGGGDERHALAHEHAQTQIGRFRAFHVFQIAEPVRDARRHALDQQRVGGVRARRARGTDQTVEDILRIGRFRHRLRKPRPAGRR